MAENHDLAGASQPGGNNQAANEAREVFPLSFEKDYMDFRGVEEVDETSVLAPKGSRAPVSAEPQKSVTGLEDVSEDDLAISAQTNAAKDS